MSTTFLHFRKHFPIKKGNHIYHISMHVYMFSRKYIYCLLLPNICHYFLLLALAMTMPLSANSAITFGMTMS